MILAQPFEATARVGEFDVIATVRGGGLSARLERYVTGSVVL